MASTSSSRTRIERAWVHRRRIPKAIIRRLLVRYVRGGTPRAERGEGPVCILLASAWGMGGTIRAAYNIAEYIAPGREVEFISIIRQRDEPFFGSFPDGLARVTALDDQRAHAPGGRLHRFARRQLRRHRSALFPPEDRGARFFSLWTDVQLVRQLRGRSGILIGNKPGLNTIITRLSPPGWVLVGHEQMHLYGHKPGMRAVMKRAYPKLDALVVLTRKDRRNYVAHLGRRKAPPIHVIPNTTRPLGGPEPDLSTKRVLAAGRFVSQKGFDLLVPAWAQVAEQRRDWTLKICGQGPLRPKVERQVEQLGLHDVVELADAVTDMGGEMARASIFVMSSRYEGFPLILVEAMSKGLGVVSFNCPTGPADIIRNRRNGIIVPPKRVGRLAKGLLEMIEDEELRRACAAAAPATAQQYTMEVVGPRWIALLDEVGPASRRPAQDAAGEVLAGR